MTLFMSAPWLTLFMKYVLLSFLKFYSLQFSACFSVSRHRLGFRWLKSSLQIGHNLILGFDTQTEQIKWPL